MRAVEAMEGRIAHQDRSSLVYFFRVSSTSRICLSILLLSTAATVHGVLQSTDAGAAAADSHACKETAPTVTSSCSVKDLAQATEDELLKCKERLRVLLSEVESALRSSAKERRKRYSPVSASLPDRESAFFLDRVNAIHVTREEELTRDAPRSTQSQHKRAKQFIPKRNNTFEECKRLSQQELVTELKQKGTYNPDLMAWDASGVIRFLDRSIVDQYERQMKSRASSEETVERNVEALERILAELNLRCDVRSPTVIARLQNLTSGEPRRSIVSPSIRVTESELRSKRETAESLMGSFRASRRADAEPHEESFSQKRQKLIGDVHIVPFGCDKRGGEEDGYLRLCAACQAIRRLPDTFFPPFINEVMCDDDKACLYFYDFPHGKCKQKHMNFVVLRNVGTDECQVWQKFNLNVRVSCECFVDEMSFFAKYV
ncbi:hypothetical protein Tcan_14123 [Toxocara canis]|uniref:Uncharacterized protein n=1 Tax=Toxocara canis TaxID=6265 RepID=A0A0B2V504_TOXCA|nr:hypothetical protein Tcan_14123 [Toxocara canis]